MPGADQNAPVRKHFGTAKEHLAGVNARRDLIRGLAQSHLDRKLKAEAEHETGTEPETAT